MGDPGVADLVLLGGDVYTVDAVGRWANAIAVLDGRIVAVGTDAEVHEWIGPHTESIELRGKMVLPGFQDAHIHAPTGGLNRLRCDLSEVHTLDEYRTILRSYAGAHPEMPWITGGGWGMDLFPGGTPCRELLDAVVPDRPVFLSNRDNHAVWVNSAALNLAGVDATTPDPPDGRIERDLTGAPQGTLHEGAMWLVRRVVPDPDPEELERAILLAQEYLHSLGITAWQDGIVGDYPTMPNAREAYPVLAGRGQLTARVIGALWWDRGRGEEQIDELIDARQRTSVGRYRATSVKIMQDGVCENLTARMLEPYLDGSGALTANLGHAFVDPELLPGIVTHLDAEGFQVHGHVIGDGAVRAMLDAIEAARETNGSSDNRHHLAHIQVVHPDDLPRFRGLGVVANGQPLWAFNEPQMAELTLPFLGPERGSWQYPFGSLVRAGATLAFGSDWPISTPNVLEEIHVAVNRTSPPTYVYGSGGDLEQTPFLPDQRIMLGQAIRAFTMGSAYLNHLDAVTGSIEVGKLADLVVVSENVFALDPADIAQARVVLTMVDGRPVYESPGL